MPGTTPSGLNKVIIGINIRFLLFIFHQVNTLNTVITGIIIHLDIEPFQGFHFLCTPFPGLRSYSNLSPPGFGHFHKPFFVSDYQFSETHQIPPNIYHSMRAYFK